MHTGINLVLVIFFRIQSASFYLRIHLSSIPKNSKFLFSILSLQMSWFCERKNLSSSSIICMEHAVWITNPPHGHENPHQQVTFVFHILLRKWLNFHFFLISIYDIFSSLSDTWKVASFLWYSYVCICVCIWIIAFIINIYVSMWLVCECCGE